MQIRGKVHKYGDNINTDEIIPARYLNTSVAKELAKHCLEDLDKKFVRKVSRGNILVVGKNFGCGSSREHAPLAIKSVGVSCIIAESFANIFYRNSINIGLPILTCPEASREIANGDEIFANLLTGEIENITQKKKYQADPFPPFIQAIIKAGGLLNRIKQKYEKEKS